MATEVGQGKVTVVPDTKPLEAGLTSVFSLLGGKFGKAGEIAGAKLDEGIAGQVGGSSKLLGTLMKGVSAAGPWGIAIGAGVAAAAGVTTALYKVGTTFDNTYRTIQRNTGATGSDLKALEQSFRTVASGSAASFGQVVTAISEVQRYTGPTGAALNGLSSQFLTLSRITKTEVAGNVENGVHALEQWNIKTAQAKPAMDALFVGSQKSGVGFSELASEVTRFSPVMHTLGLNFNQSVAMLASFGKTGTSTQRIMMGLQMAASKLAKEQGPLGTSAQALSKAQQNLSDVQERLSAKMKLSVTDHQLLEHAQLKVADAENKMGKAGTSPIANAERLKVAQQGLADVQARLGAKMQLSVTDHQALAKAQEKVALAQQTMASTGKDIPSALNAAIKSIKDAKTDTQALQIAANLFGTRGGPAMVQAIRSGKFNFEEMSKAIAGSNGAIERTAKQTATVGGAFGKLKNAAEVSIAPLGQAVSQGINKELILTMTKLTPVINSFAKDLPGAMTSVGNALKPLIPVFQNLFAIGQALFPYFVRYVKQVGVEITDLWNISKPALKLLGDALAVITDLLTGKWGAAWDKVKALPGDLLNVLSKIPKILEDTILRPFQILVPGVAKSLQDFGQLVMRIPGDVTRWLSKLGTSVWNAIFGGFSRAYSATSSALASFWSQVAALPGNVTRYLAGLGGAVWNAIYHGFAEAVSAAGSGLGAFWQYLSRVAGQVGSYLSGIGGAVWNAFYSGFTRVLSAASSGISSLWGWLSGLGARVAWAVGDLGSYLFNAGASIITGMVRGVASQAGSLASAVMNQIKSLPGAALKFLHIGSPSKLFADIGKQIPAGLAMGITTGTPSLLSTHKAMLAALPTQVPMMPAPGLAGVGGYASRGPAVVVQNAHFSTELDIEAFMRKASWVVQTQRV